MEDLSSFVYRCFPFFNSLALVRSYWSFARNDVLLIQIILYISMFHEPQLQQPGRNEKLNRLMTTFIALLNGRLSDAATSTTDESVAAVVNLIGIEVCKSAIGRSRTWGGRA